MINETIPIDSLTGVYTFVRGGNNLSNQNYISFARKIDEYIKENKNSNFIMIDLQKFKLLNDNYGHEEGDNVLKFFAKTLTKYFDDSIIARFGGDEFCIVTKYNPTIIDEKFKMCSQEIEEEVKKDINDKSRTLKIIKQPFHFNAGSFEIVHSLNEAFEKADKMMYYAKKNKLYYQEYNEEIWNKLTSINKLEKDFNDKLQNNKLSYIKKNIYDNKFNITNMYQIHTRYEDNSKIFTKENYNLLRNSKSILNLDIYNIINIFKYLSLNNNSSLTTIFLDYTTLLNENSFSKIIEEINKYNLNNIVFAINLEGINSNNYNDLIKNINILKQLKILIRLDKLNNNIGDVVMNLTEPNFISFQSEYIEKVILNKRLSINFKYKLLELEYLNIKVIFDNIKNNNILEFINDIYGLNHDNLLFIENYIKSKNINKK